MLKASKSLELSSVDHTNPMKTPVLITFVRGVIKTFWESKIKNAKKFQDDILVHLWTAHNIAAGVPRLIRSLSLLSDDKNQLLFQTVLTFNVTLLAEH